MDNLLLDILIFLKDKELYLPIDIKDFLISHKSVDPNSAKFKDTLISFFNDLNTKGLLQYYPNLKIKNGRRDSESSFFIPIIEFESIKVKLSVDGYNFINNHLQNIKLTDLTERQTQAAELSNKSSIRTNNSIIRIAIISTIVATVSTYATYQTYKISDASNQRELLKEKQNLKLDLLQKELKDKSHLVFLQQKSIDSLHYVLSTLKKTYKID